MALWSNSDAANSKPKYLTTAEKATTYGVDAAETAAEASQGTPVAHAGWVLRTTGSGGRAGRTFSETLVAMGSMTSDLEDTVMQDLNIVIGTQPAALTVEAGNPAVFTVAATTVPSGGTITYAWEMSDDNGDTWSSAAGSTNSATYTIAAAAEDGYLYRVQLSATGATTVTSNEVLLTVTS